MSKPQKLYKRDSKGKMRYWFAVASMGVVTTTSGICGREASSEVSESYTAKPTNVGKKSERNSVQQAEFEVEALYRNKIEKKRYMPDLLAAGTYVSSDVQLVHDYTKKKNKDKIVWGEVDGQFKLDGVRCRITLDRDAGVLRVWSRENKPYSLPDPLYREVLQVLSENKDINTLDGEIYFHGMDFEDIISRIKDVNHPERDQLQFWIYDTIDTGLNWAARREVINKISDTKYKNIMLVKSVRLRNEADALAMLAYAIEAGFEGLILRNWKGMYLCGKRSYDVQKWKLFEDAEFEMTGVEKDKRGHGVGVFKTSDGKPFNARWKAPDAKRQHLADHPEAYVGKRWTIRFQKWSQDGIPIFPVAIAVRDYE